MYIYLYILYYTLLSAIQRFTIFFFQRHNKIRSNACLLSVISINYFIFYRHTIMRINNRKIFRTTPSVSHQLTLSSY